MKSFYLINISQINLLGKIEKIEKNDSVFIINYQ